MRGSLASIVVRPKR